MRKDPRDRFGVIDSSGNRSVSLNIVSAGDAKEKKECLADGRWLRLWPGWRPHGRAESSAKLLKAKEPPASEGGR